MIYFFSLFTFLFTCNSAFVVSYTFSHFLVRYLESVFFQQFNQFSKKQYFFAIQVPVEAANLYHAVLQYAYALNKTLSNNLEPNGRNIINALKGHTFDST